MGELVELIVGKYDGSLKAEHGTGVNMAPYVEREWGEKATELMWRVKRLADPDGVLAPGVVLNRDPGAHLRNLKTTPPIEEEATTCVECGFCEPVCPSRQLTTTPRQRIVLRREMARQPAGSPLSRALLEEFEYDGLETCAADGTCRLACPLGIDTGALVKRLARRAARRGRRSGRRCWRRKRWGERASGRPRGGPARWRARRRLRRCCGRSAAAAAGPARRCRDAGHEGAAAVYVPACINRIFGARRRRRVRPQPARGAGRGLAAGRAAGLDPARRRRQLLRGPLELEGLPRRRTPQGQRDGRAALALERRGRAAGRDRRQLLHPREPPIWSPTPAASKLEILDSIAWADRLLPDLR